MMIVKVKLSVLKYCIVKAQEGVDINCTYLTLASGEGDLCCSHIIPREIDHGTCWIEGWVDPRISLNMMTKRKISAPDENQTLAIQFIVLLLLK